MKKIALEIAAAFFAMLAVAILNLPAQAGEADGFVIIVHPSSKISSINRFELAQIFLKKKSRWPGGEVANPVDQKLTSKVREAFSKTVLKKPISAVNAYWQQRIFSGRDVPPPQKSSDAAVILYVSSHEGAVGYVTADADVGKAKVLTVAN